MSRLRRFGAACRRALLFSLRWTLRLTLVLLVVGGIAAAGGAWYINTQILSELPEDLGQLASWRPPTACQIVDRDGKLLDTFWVERRFPAEHDKLPPHVWQAFIASEDGSFFEHPGVDAMGILRALVVNYKAGQTVQGGSTLTQQVVKNTLLTPERSLRRKIKEAVLALRLERELSKQQILALYLDLVYLGSGNYGVEAAARDYFGVHAHELDVAQAALLAGLVPAPSRMSPRFDRTEALRRRSLVIRRMVDEGYLDAVDAIAWDDAPLRLATPQRGPKGPRAGYLTAARRDIRASFGPGAATSGLRVTVPLEPEVQAAAEIAAKEAIEAHLERNGPRVLRGRAAELPPDPEEPCFTAQLDLRQRQVRTATRSWPFDGRLLDSRVHDDRTGAIGNLRGLVRGGELIGVCEVDGAITLDARPWAESSVVVIEHATGQVVALAGGNDSELEGFVRGLQARRQPGSSFKAYVYAQALIDGLTPVDTVVDSPISMPGGNGKMWSPKNYGGGYAGSMSLTRALASSSNTVAVRLTLKSGTKTVADLARRMGISTPLRTDPTIALGSSEVTPLDQASAYATIGRLGRYLPPTWIASASSADGTDLTPRREGEQVLPEGVAYELIQMLQAVVRSGTGRAADVDGLEIAGKTGTTNDNIDAWFVGLTPRYTIAVWVGTDATYSLGAKETGGRAAAPAFKKVAESLPEGPARFPVPDDVVLIPIDGELVGLRRSHVPDRLLSAPMTLGPLRPLRSGR
jgi:penicillin-binding protein 1A